MKTSRPLRGSVVFILAVLRRSFRTGSRNPEARDYMELFCFPTTQAPENSKDSPPENQRDKYAEQKNIRDFGQSTSAIRRYTEPSFDKVHKF
jgi:hypothetical protein